jgi:hypothetical protein
LEACDTARVSRAGFYRHFDEHLPRQADTELRQHIQQICLDHRCYGSRRVIIELQKLQPFSLFSLFGDSLFGAFSGTSLFGDAEPFRGRTE